MKPLKKFLLLYCIYIVQIPLCQSQPWSTLGNGTPSIVYAFCSYNGKLIISSVGPVGGISNGLASWDGFTWDSLGCGTTQGQIKCFAEYNNELIVAGGFYNMGNNLTNVIPNTSTIAAWNGSQWHGLGLGGAFAGSDVNALASYNGELYAGGGISIMGGVPCNKIARWNGTTWNNVGSGFSGPSTLYSMCVFNGELYVGGAFTMAGGVPANGIARWDGSQWHAVGSGVYGYPFTMLVDSVRSRLIIGGNFICSDTSMGYGICAWDGTNFLPLGHGLPNVSNAAHSTCFYNGLLFASTPSKNATIYDTCLMYWDSTSWKPILGPNNGILALSTYKNELYIGGGFDKIDTLNFSYIARYSNPTLNIPENIGQTVSIEIYPNPSKSVLTISYLLPNGITKAQLKIYNIKGTLVKTVKLPNQKGKIELPEGLLPKGVYLVSLTTKNGVTSEKFVVE